jgi:hypothetical protein
MTAISPFFRDVASYVCTGAALEAVDFAMDATLP